MGLISVLMVLIGLFGTVIYTMLALFHSFKRTGKAKRMIRSTVIALVMFIAGAAMTPAPNRQGQKENRPVPTIESKTPASLPIPSAPQEEAPQAPPKQPPQISVQPPPQTAPPSAPTQAATVPPQTQKSDEAKLRTQYLQLRTIAIATIDRATNDFALLSRVADEGSSLDLYDALVQVGDAESALDSQLDSIMASAPVDFQPLIGALRTATGGLAVTAYTVRDALASNGSQLDRFSQAKKFMLSSQIAILTAKEQIKVLDQRFNPSSR